MEMGTRLRIAREAKDWSQSELARRAGVDQTTISSLELKKSTVSRADVLFMLADALQVSPRWLATGVGPMAPMPTDSADALPELTAEQRAAVQALIAAMKQR